MIPKYSITLLLILIIFGAFFLVQVNGNKAVYIPEIIIEKKVEETAHLSFVGDIMLDRGVRGKVNKYGNGDFNFAFEKANFLKEPDLMFGNLEGPVSNRGSNVGSIYSFRFDPIVFDVLKGAGFDVLSMANNHIGDWTRIAIEDTINHGMIAGFQMVGGGIGYENAIEPRIYDVKGIKVGYLGFSDFGPPYVILSEKSGTTTPGILSASDPNISKIIKDASLKTDILVVSYHFGDEYQPKSNERQKYLARLAINNGAKIVAGHHPHVEQEIEEYNGGLIAYSLGNFVFDQYFSKETMKGLKLDVTVNKDSIVSFGTSTIYINSNYQPSMLE